MNRKSTVARRRVASLCGNRMTLAHLINECNQPQTPDVCLHFGINWHVTRSAFQS